jgi:hypothetical protein
MQANNSKCIDEQSGFVVIDFCRCSSCQVSDIYQDFGLLCARGQVRRALLKIGDEDAYAHFALRDVLSTVAHVVGIPLDFRLALLAGSDPMASVCGVLREELRSLGCDTRVFRIERQAMKWLRARQPAARRSLPQAAICR